MMNMSTNSKEKARGKVGKSISPSSILHDWWTLIRGYDTRMRLQTTGSPMRLAMRSAGTDACRSSGFIGGGQTFKFFFDAPPRKPLLWACLLAWASRDLYPVCLWFARALIPHPICSGRDTGLSRRTNRNLAVISQSEHFFFVSPLSAHPLHFNPLYHPTPLLPPSLPLFLHIFRYNYGGSLQMFLLFPLPDLRRWVEMWCCSDTGDTCALILNCSHIVNRTCFSLINSK